MTLRTAGLSVALAAIALLPAAPDAQHAGGDSPAIVDLGSLGHDASLAAAVNNKNQVVGWIVDNFAPFLGPFLWEDGVMRELASGPDLLDAIARDINDRSQIVGFATDALTFETIAVMWEDGQPTRLPVPPGDMHCAAQAINDRGDVAGFCATPDGNDFQWHGVLWRDGVVIDLGSLPGEETFPSGINDRGVVLGDLRSPEGVDTGSFVWTDGAVTRLPAGFMARDINDRGQIAGRRRASPDSGFEAVILDRGTIVRLPSLSIPQFVTCSAEAINQRGDVGGGCSNVPMVWVHGDPRVLPGLADVVATVTDINDRGAAVGYATAADGSTHAVLWPRAAKPVALRVTR